MRYGPAVHPQLQRLMDRVRRGHIAVNQDVRKPLVQLLIEPDARGYPLA